MSTIRVLALLVPCCIAIGHAIPQQPAAPQPPVERSAKPFVSQLITTWGEQVTPRNAWAEYPRPQLVRDGWQNLNGHWDYAVTPIAERTPPAAWDGRILVPFALESRLGGVQRLLARVCR